MVEIVDQQYGDRRTIVNFVDFLGVVGYLTVLVLGMLLRWDFLPVVILGAALMLLCFISSTVLCFVWRIPRSWEW